ncbi:LysR family transcriptional regulator [Terrabacter sp. BE26]|uniref:LysR family transcriptional regulator n=1 Tax=Terrabacter sp. BE26 TaxID=2898152 RepID=UPI0035BE1E98
MDLDTGLLRAFLAVGRTGNVTQAAAELFISQPALSGRISRLERSVGARLFERHQGGVSLTDAGHTFVPYAEQVLAALDRGVGDVVAASRLGVLRLDVPDAGLAVPRRAVELLRAALPEVELDVSERGSVDQERRIRSGELDLALGTAGPRLAGMAQRRIASEPLAVALPAADPRAAAGGLSAEDLRDDIHYIPSTAFAPEWVALVHAALDGAPRTTVPLHTESTRTPLETVANGGCVAVSLASTPVPAGVVLVPLVGAPPHVWVARHLKRGPHRALVETAVRAVSAVQSAAARDAAETEGETDAARPGQD